MRRASRLLLLVSCCWAGAALAADSPPGTVVLLSWDGMRHDYPDRGHFPGLARMQRDGIRAGRLTPVYPSSTFPGHVSLATGTYPDRHGIVDNHFFDRARPGGAGVYRMSSDADWIQAEPLWIAAQRQGVPTATYFWVGSETDWRGQRSRYRVAPFDGQRPESAKVDQILEWLRLPVAERPRLIMSYWAGVDDEGHWYGPESARIVSQIAAQDAQLQRLLAGIDALAGGTDWQAITLLIVSDHGMAETSEYIDLDTALREAGVSARVSGSAVAQVYVDQSAGSEPSIARAGAALGAIDNVEVYRGDQLPQWMRLAHPSRTGDWVVTTEPPYTFSQPAGFEGAIASALGAVGWTFGSHGYHPQLEDMGGVFLALGRGIPADLLIPEVHQVDIAATVAGLLGINPPRDSEGRRVPGIGGDLMTHGAHH